jgi:cysteinyl-tRNA synthetase
MRLYNTLGRKLEEFKPQKPGEVTLYTCGPTVYDHAQIGNLRAFIFDDTLRRALEATGLNVRHVMNITDVGHLVSDADEGEDKLEKGARREGKSVWEVAEHYTQIFKADAKALNLLPPSVNPKRTQNSKQHDPYARATDFIDEQIDMVRRLLDKGFAYQTEQAIYFDITKLEDYGKLTGQKLTDKEVGARHDVVTDTNKRHPYDFAVWFFAVGHFKDHSMQWQTPWGSGFPGWHLECSAIIHATLAPEPIDIHTGGVDHIGTHHTNEIAQTEAAFDKSLARFWMHNEFALVDGVKMSKSKQNFYTLKDITDRGYSPLVLRLRYLQAHYRSETNFTWESMDGAKNTLLNLYAWADLVFQSDISKPLSNAEGQQLTHEVKTAMSDDLDTPRALAAIAEAVNFGARPSRKLLRELDLIFGLDLAKRHDIDQPEKDLIADREAARKAKDWAKADQLRRQLEDQNLEIDDTPHGPHWHRTRVS